MIMQQCGFHFILVSELRLFPNDFDQYPLIPMAIKLTIKDLFPRAKIKASLRNGYHHFPAHDLAFQVGIGIVFTGAVMVVVVRIGIEGGQLFEPDAEVMVQSTFIIVDEHAAGNVHAVDQRQAFFDATGLKSILHLMRDVHKAHLGGQIQGEVVGVGFHEIGARSQEKVARINQEHLTDCLSFSPLSPGGRGVGGEGVHCT
jgi:hypothetical protein